MSGVLPGLEGYAGRNEALERVERARTKESWRDMLRRCNDPTRQNYAFYGGRGIEVCVRWHSFDAFLADMGARPVGLSLDRIDNARGYEPGNCRWADHPTQCRNRRSTVLNERLVAELRDEHERGVGYRTIAKRRGLAWPTVRKAIMGRSWA